MLKPPDSLGVRCSFSVEWTNVPFQYIMILKGDIHMNDIKSLSHTRWNCKYHIVFIPKYRRKEIYGKIKNDIGIILRQLCKYKDVEIMEAHACSDHIHMLVAIPPRMC